MYLEPHGSKHFNGGSANETHELHTSEGDGSGRDGDGRRRGHEFDGLKGNDNGGAHLGWLGGIRPVRRPGGRGSSVRCPDRRNAGSWSDRTAAGRDLPAASTMLGEFGLRRTVRHRPGQVRAQQLSGPHLPLPLAFDPVIPLSLLGEAEIESRRLPWGNLPTPVWVKHFSVFQPTDSGRGPTRLSRRRRR